MLSTNHTGCEVSANGAIITCSYDNNGSLCLIGCIFFTSLFVFLVWHIWNGKRKQFSVVYRVYHLKILEKISFLSSFDLLKARVSKEWLAESSVPCLVRLCGQRSFNSSHLFLLSSFKGLTPHPAFLQPENQEVLRCRWLMWSLVY